MSGRRTSSQPKRNAAITKEVAKHTLLAQELFRICVSRSEEIVNLKTVSDKKSGKIRLGLPQAEQKLHEAEFKEEIRIGKEDEILLELHNITIENPVEKKQIEKYSRKILRLIMQMEDDVSDKEMSTSEAHVFKIMNTKINADTTYVTMGPEGMEFISINQASISSSLWKEQFSKPIKVLESCLYGAEINPYNSLCYCVHYGRKVIASELEKQWKCVEKGDIKPILSVTIKNKKSKSAISLKTEKVSELKVNSNIPPIEWMTGMMNMLFDTNTDIIKAHNTFWTNKFKTETKTEEKKEYDIAKKTLRARNYEKEHAVNPFKKSIPLILLSKFSEDFYFKHEDTFLDLENPYFHEDDSIETRLKVINACRVIQRTLGAKIQSLYKGPCVLIQKGVRKLISEDIYLREKYFEFRKIYAEGRLKNWFELLAKKWKIYRAEYEVGVYDLEKILIIQNFVRRIIAKKKINEKINFWRIKNRKFSEKWYLKKRETWMQAILHEKYTLKHSEDSEIELLEFELKEENLEDYELKERIRRLEIQEIQMRKEYIHKSRMDRVKAMIKW